MHNLQDNFNKILGIIQETLNNQLNTSNNFRFYPNLPTVSDSEIIAMSITMEALGIRSESALYSFMKSESPALFQRFPDRRNFNKRRRKLKDKIDESSFQLAKEISTGTDCYIVDSMPLPICRTVRAPSLKVMKEEQDFQPTYGYQPIDRMRYYGFKLHLLSTERGSIFNYLITPANIHDIKMIDDLTKEFVSNCSVLGDKGYFSKPIQLSLFEESNINLHTPPKKSTGRISEWSVNMNIKRKSIETIFSQLEDQFLIKRNYAKSFLGFHTRIISKIAAHTFLQFLNLMAGRPLNQIKYALLF